MPKSTPSAAAAGPDLSGSSAGDFQLLRRLGHGAMADVYLAEQRQLKRRVAVKVLKPALAGDATYLRRFEREAQAAAALVHANIVQIYEVGHAGDLHYIAQEYVEGLNLRDWLARHGPPDLPHALSIMCQTAAALAKAGEQGIVHRDIKPENILLTREGEVKVADFGLAHFTADTEAAHLTQAGMTMGTPLYMSPEQVEGKPLDHRSDLYSFGVTCYHLLAGQPPFTGETALAVAVQHLKGEPKPLETVRTDLPPALCHIVQTLLAKSPLERFSSARTVLRELRRVQIECCGGQWPEDLPGWEPIPGDANLEARAAATQQLAGLMATQAIERSRGRRRRGLIVAALVAVAAVGGWLGWRVTAREPLLADAAAARPTVPVEKTVVRQWYLASQEGTPEAWQSVIDNFPDKPLFVDRAEQQLGLVYLQQKDYAKALEVFTHLADAGDVNKERAAFGLAGQFIIYSVQDRTEQADRALERLWPLRTTGLKSPSMRQALAAELTRSGRITTPAGHRWKQWIDDQRPSG